MFSAAKRDPGGIGFIDDVGGSVDGLTSCTESLGFESSDERRADDKFGSFDHIDELCSRKSAMFCSKGKPKDVNKEMKNFPPPLTSLSQDGKPTFFLRAVRGDGRLRLTEVMFGRPKILSASRQDGRLKLHLIRDEDEEDDDDDIDEEQTEEENEMKLIEESVEEMVEKKVDKTMQLETIEEMIEEEEEGEEEEEERAEGWHLPASSGGGDGSLRCHEQVNHRQHHHHHGRHHQNDLHVWRQHCVTIR